MAAIIRDTRNTRPRTRPPGPLAEQLIALADVLSYSKVRTLTRAA